MRLIIILACLLLFVGCSEESKPDPPEVRRASIEDKAAKDDGDNKRAEIRTAAREFVSRTFPDWKLNGLESDRYIENNYTVAADISKGDERRTVSVNVVLFVDDDGHTYWKVEHLPREGEQRSPVYVIRPYKQ